MDSHHSVLAAVLMATPTVASKMPIPISRCNPEANNPETNTAVFRVLYSRPHGLAAQGEKVTLQIDRILLHRSEIVEEANAFKVETVPGETIDISQSMVSAGIPDEPGVG